MNSSILLLEAIGYLDEDLLERSEKKKGNGKYIRLGWIALAACFCVVCVGIWGMHQPTKGDMFQQESAHSAGTQDSFLGGIADRWHQHSDSGTEDTLENVRDMKARFVLSGWSQDGDGSSAVVINSTQQLQAFMAAENLQHMTENLKEECLKYNDAFFEKKQLIVLPLEGQSSSVSHELVDIRRSQSGWFAHVQRVYPECMTSDIVYWCALIEVEAGLIGEGEQIQILYLNQNKE